MKDLIKQSARSGFIFGVVILFLMLFGLTTTLADILGGFLNLNSNARAGNTGGLMVLFALLSLWAGSRAAASDKSNLKSVLISGATAGLIIGLMVAAFTLLVGFLDGADVEMRDYLAQLSRQNILFLVYGRSVAAGALITFGIYQIFGMLGGFLVYYLESRKTGENVQKQILILKEKVLDTNIIKKYQANPRSKLIGYAVLLFIVFLFPQFLGKYWNYAMGTVGIYVLMGLGLNIVVGLAGLLDLGYVAFFAIGA
jgi:hypothetical protein